MSVEVTRLPSGLTVVTAEMRRTASGPGLPMA